jgi:opacity protein-like surface antigen
MKGSVSLFNVGIQGEYYFKDLREFMFPYSDIKWNPYVSLGFKYSRYTNTLTSDLGDWQTDPTVLPLKYRGANQTAVGSGNAFSLTLGAGTRYKLSEKFDLAANFNWQYFFSDAIDGLQTDHVSNKKNEWLIHLQVGIIYHLNFSGGIFCKN